MTDTPEPHTEPHPGHWPYPWVNLAEMFSSQAEKMGEAPFLWRKTEGAYTSVTWSEAAARTRELAAGLKAKGIGAGDRVMLVAENRPEWLIADMAVVSLGAITVPAYTTNTEDDHLHILTDSEAAGALISGARIAKNFLPAAAKADACRFVAHLEPLEASIAGAAGGTELLSWADLGAAGSDEDRLPEASTISGDETCCLIYTSGTGGRPKGVMLSHRAILHNIAGALDVLQELDPGGDVFLSFLPLSHAYEHTAGQFLPIALGAQIYYAESTDKLLSNLADARPTLMTAVPRLYETMRQRIERGVEKQGGLKAKLFRTALELGRRKYLEPGSLTMTERLMDRLVDKLVRDKVRGRFGGRLKALVSGGAPLNRDVGLYFTALGLTLLQGYGQTESAPLISVNRPSHVKLHAVGPPVINTEVKIADDGEILVRGDLVMQGYWRNDEATQAAIQDGWLHTGDIGHLDEHGHLVITDRKKDIIVNSGGDNVAPQRIEGVLALAPEIGQAMVYGDKRPHLVALLVPDTDWLKEWAQGADKQGGLAELADDPDLHKALAPVISAANQKLSTIEKVRKFMIAPEPFSIENGQMTPTLKVRRHVLKAAYGEALEGLYA